MENTGAAKNTGQTTDASRVSPKAQRATSGGNQSGLSFHGVRTQPSDPATGITSIHGDAVTRGCSSPQSGPGNVEISAPYQYTPTERHWQQLLDEYIDHGVLVRTHSHPNRQIKDLFSGDPVSACWLLPGIKMSLFFRGSDHITPPGLILSAQCQKLARFKTNATSLNISSVGSYDRLPNKTTTSNLLKEHKSHRNDFSFLIKMQEFLVRSQKMELNLQLGYLITTKGLMHQSSGHVSHYGSHFPGKMKLNKTTHTIFGKSAMNNEVVIGWDNSSNKILGIMLEYPLHSEKIKLAVDTINSIYHFFPSQKEYISNLPLVMYTPEFTRLRFLGSIEAMMNTFSGATEIKNTTFDHLHQILNGEPFTIKHLLDSSRFFDNIQRIPDAIALNFNIYTSINCRAVLISSCYRQVLEHFGYHFTQEEALVTSYAVALTRSLHALERHEAILVLEWFRERMLESKVPKCLINSIFHAMVVFIGYEMPPPRDDKAMIFLFIINNTSSASSNWEKPDNLFSDWCNKKWSDLVDKLKTIKIAITDMDIPSIRMKMEPSWILMLNEISMIIPEMVVKTINRNKDSRTHQAWPFPEIMLASMPSSRDIYNACCLLDQIDLLTYTKPNKTTAHTSLTDAKSPPPQSSISVSEDSENPVLPAGLEQLPNLPVSVQVAHYQQHGLPLFPGTICSANISDLSKAAIEREMRKQPSSVVVSSIKSSYATVSRPWEKIHYSVWHHSPLEGLDNVPSLIMLDNFQGYITYTQIETQYWKELSKHVKTHTLLDIPDDWQCAICLVNKTNEGSVEDTSRSSSVSPSDSDSPPKTAGFDTSEGSSTFDVNRANDEPEATFIELIKCQHIFHKSCIRSMVKAKEYKCPTCRAPLLSFRIGNQPSSTMTWSITAEECLGENAAGTIAIVYKAPPGKWATTTGVSLYWGDTKTAFLPNHEKGRKALFMLKTAFERGLILTVGYSVTRNIDNAVTWYDIPHKTRIHGGLHGYPDQGYVDRLINILKTLGVTEPV